MLPTTVKTISEYAFCECSSLSAVRIPAATATIGDNAFNTGSIKDIYTWTVVPTTIGQNTFAENTYLHATVHVPATAWKLYYWGERWSQFQNFTSFNEPYEYFYIADKDLNIEEDTPRLEGADGNNPDADLNTGSGLIVDGDKSQDLGDVNLDADGNGGAASIIGGNSSTATSGANVNIDNLKIQITIKKGKWYFFAFPFDIEFGNIHFNGQFVWRYYDGEHRALEGSGAWKNMAGKLLKGQGYIFQASKDGTLTLTIPNASIGGEDFMVALEGHASANAQDASWNLVGNPFTSYYELADLGYNAPITVWNGSTYEAFSPADDDKTLHPFQAFFVQKPASVDGVGFEAALRETKNQSEDPNYRTAAQSRRRARARANMNRQLVNIEVSDGVNADKTRVVFNEQSSAEYEMECDAAKFFSSGVPQIYTLDAKNAQYAINERPEGDGTVRVGFAANKDGEFTIKATRMDCPVTLKDLATGAAHDLSEGDYVFTAKAGATDSRFLLVKGSGATAVESIAGDTGADAEYYSVSGVKLAGDAHNGIVIEKKGNKAQKLIKR